MTDRKLLVSAGPHVRGGASTTSVMRDVLIALLPAVVASVLVFGTRALVLEIICVDVSILFEYLFRKITKRTNTISDLSAAVTGLLLAMNRQFLHHRHRCRFRRDPPGPHQGGRCG